MDDTSRSVFTAPRWNPAVVLLEPCARNQEPVAFDQRSRPRSKSLRSLEPRDTSFYKLLRSRSCCLFSHTAGATRDSRELSCTRNPIVIPACNFNQSRYVKSTFPFLSSPDKFPTMLLAVLSCYEIVGSQLYMRIVHGSRRVRRQNTPGTCDVSHGAPGVRSIIHRPIVRRSTPAAGQLTPQSVSPAWKNTPAFLPWPSVRFPPDTYTFTHKPIPHARYVTIKVLS